MILHRIFGMIATAAFALGIAVQVKSLTSPHLPDPFDPLLLTYAGLVVLAIGYLTLRAERKHGLIDPYDDSIDIIEVAYSLPTWARAVCFLLVCYIALLWIGVTYLGPKTPLGQSVFAQLPADSVLRQSIPANGLGALFASLFLFSSFVTAAFLLFRKPIKEFH
jgi:hypothetical protein